MLKTATLSIEGFDPATGETTWSVPMTDPGGQTPQAALGRVEIVGENTLLVPTPTGDELIDPATGTARPAPASTSAVCVTAILTPLAGGERTVGGQTSNSYATGSKAIQLDQLTSVKLLHHPQTLLPELLNQPATHRVGGG